MWDWRRTRSERTVAEGRMRVMIEFSSSLTPTLSPKRERERSYVLSTSVLNCRDATVSMARSTEGAERTSFMV